MEVTKMYVVDIVTVWKLSLAFATLIKVLVIFSEMLSISMVTNKLQVAISTLTYSFHLDQYHCMGAELQLHCTALF